MRDICLKICFAMAVLAARFFLPAPRCLESKRSKPVKRAFLILPALIAFIFFATVAPCHASEYSGRIVDADTGEPIEGAVVLICWHSILIHNWYREIFDVKEVLTDKNGLFATDHKPNLNPLRHIYDPPDLEIFKGGYKPIIGVWHMDSFKRMNFSAVGGRVTFKLKTANREERLKILREVLLIWPDEYEQLLSSEVDKERKFLGITR